MRDCSCVYFFICFDWCYFHLFRLIMFSLGIIFIFVQTKTFSDSDNSGTLGSA